MGRPSQAETLRPPMLIFSLASLFQIGVSLSPFLFSKTSLILLAHAAKTLTELQLLSKRFCAKRHAFGSGSDGSGRKGKLFLNRSSWPQGLLPQRP